MLVLDGPAASALRHGQVGSRMPPPRTGAHRCYGPDGEFLGVATATAGTLRAERMLRCDGEADPRA